MNSSKSIILITTFILILSSGYSVTSDSRFDPISSEITIDSHTDIANITTWNNLDGELIFNQTIRILNGGVLQIYNSDLNVTNLSEPENDLGEGISVLEGGTLEIINSSISITSISHAITAGVALGSASGSITISNSSIQSTTGDALQINGDFGLDIQDSSFSDSLDDGISITNYQRDLNLSGLTLSRNGGDGLNIEQSDNIAIYLSNSTLENNGDEGLQLDVEDIDLYIYDVLTSDNDDKGFDIVNPDGNIILNQSSVISNFEDGSQFEGSTNLTIVDSYFGLNGLGSGQNRHGAQIDNIEFTNIINSEFIANTGDGINSQNTNLRVIDTYIFESGDEGIQYDSSFTSRDHYFNNLTVIDAPGGDGIKFNSHYGTIVMENSHFSGGDDGIQITGGQSTFYGINLNTSANRENGIEIDSVTNFTLFDSVLNDNSVTGLEIIGSPHINLENLVLNRNSIGAINIVDSTAILTNIDASGNTGIPVGSYGLTLQNTTHVVTNSYFNDNSGIGINLIDSTGSISDVNASDNGLSGITMQGSTTELTSIIIESNQENGIQSTNSTLEIQFSSINNNQNHGFNLLSGSDFEINNNTIQYNLRSGIFISNSSVGVIHYNQFGWNGDYAIQAARRSDGTIIDARFNYFGSDEGPRYNIESDQQRDGITGPLNVSQVLTSTGEVVEFVPPEPEDNVFGYSLTQIFLFLGVLSIVLSIVSLFVISYYYQTWKDGTKPRSVLLIAPSGLPLEEYHFQKSKADGALISGFLSAISSFGAEVMDQTTEGFRIREIAYDNFTILLDKIHTSMLAVVVDSSNYLVKRRVKQLAKEIFEKYPQLEPQEGRILNVSGLEDFDTIVKFHLREFFVKEE